MRDLWLAVLTKWKVVFNIFVGERSHVFDAWWYGWKTKRYLAGSAHWIYNRGGSIKKTYNVWRVWQHIGHSPSLAIGGRGCLLANSRGVSCVRDELASLSRSMISSVSMKTCCRVVSGSVSGRDRASSSGMGFCCRISLLASATARLRSCSSGRARMSAFAKLSRLCMSLQWITEFL